MFDSKTNEGWFNYLRRSLEFILSCPTAAKTTTDHEDKFDHSVFSFSQLKKYLDGYRLNGYLLKGAYYTTRCERD